MRFQEFADAFPPTIAVPSLRFRSCGDVPRDAHVRSRACSRRTRTRAEVAEAVGWYLDRIESLCSESRRPCRVRPRAPRALVGERARALMCSAAAARLHLRSCPHRSIATGTRAEVIGSLRRRLATSTLARGGPRTRGIRPRGAGDERGRSLCRRRARRRVSERRGGSRFASSLRGRHRGHPRVLAVHPAGAYIPCRGRRVTPAASASRRRGRSGRDRRARPFLGRSPDLVWQIDDVESLWTRSCSSAEQDGSARSTRFRVRSRTSSRRNDPRSRRVGSPRPRTSSPGWCDRVAAWS